MVAIPINRPCHQCAAPVVILKSTAVGCRVHCPHCNGHGKLKNTRHGAISAWESIGRKAIADGKAKSMSAIEVPEWVGKEEGKT